MLWLILVLFALLLGCVGCDSLFIGGFTVLLLAVRGVVFFLCDCLAA